MAKPKPDSHFDVLMRELIARHGVTSQLDIAVCHSICVLLCEPMTPTAASSIASLTALLPPVKHSDDLLIPNDIDTSRFTDHQLHAFTRLCQIGVGQQPTRLEQRPRSDTYWAGHDLICLIAKIARRDGNPADTELTEIRSAMSVMISPLSITSYQLWRGLYDHAPQPAAPPPAPPEGPESTTASERRVTA
jgi:hypothetical protein